MTLVTITMKYFGMCLSEFPQHRSVIHFHVDYFKLGLLGDTLLPLFNRKIFLNDDDSIKKVGDTMKRPNFCKTLRKIADDPHTFYNGSLARDIVSDLRERG